MLGDLPLEGHELPIAKGQLGERAVLAGGSRQPRLVGQNLGIHQRPLEFLEAAEFLLEITADPATNGHRRGISHGSGSPQDHEAGASTFFFLRLA